MIIEQYSIWWADLNPTIGAEISKKRPCVVISPFEMNKNLQTVLIAPITNTQKDNYPSRIPIKLDNISGWVVVDQLRTVDKSRLCNKIGYLKTKETMLIKKVIKELFVD